MAVPEEPPLVTVVVSTRDRHALVRQAVASVLAQDGVDGAGDRVGVEILVVDDGSEPPVVLDSHPGLRVLRQTNQGVAAARNTGLAAARGRFITYLDDDDVLTPGALKRAMHAYDVSRLPHPRAVLSAVDEVAPDGTVVDRRLPPTLPAGRPFALTELAPGRSHGVKQSLVVPTCVLRDLGGWDPSFRSRVTTELFMRLGQVCAFQGIDEPGYQLCAHEGPRISKDAAVRQQSWRLLASKHEDLFARHRPEAAALALMHARDSWTQRQRWAAASAVVQATRLAPTRVLAGVARAACGGASELASGIRARLSGRHRG